MIQNILMVGGGSLWLTGELWGVWRNRHGSKTRDTTSQWVWLVERKVPLARLLIAGFVVWLGIHFWQ